MKQAYQDFVQFLLSSKQNKPFNNEVYFKRQNVSLQQFKKSFVITKSFLLHRLTVNCVKFQAVVPQGMAISRCYAQREVHIITMFA